MEITTLELKISAQAQEATKSINDLKKAMNGLNRSVSEKKLDALANGFANLNSKLSSIDTSGIKQLNKYTKAFNDLGDALLRVKYGMKGMNFSGMDFVNGRSFTDAEMHNKRQADLNAAFANYSEPSNLQGGSEVDVDAWRQGISMFNTNAIASMFATIAQKVKSTLQPLKDFFASIKRIAMYRLIRSALKTIAEGFETGIQNMAKYSDAMNGLDTHNANGVMSELASKAQEVTNTIGSAAIPVIKALTPTILWLADALIYCVNAFNMFVSALQGGKTYTKASEGAVDYAKSLDTATGSAKALKDATAGIDELNVISQDSGSGGGSSSTSALDMFSEELISPKILENLELIKDLATAIGIAFLGWKLASMFTSDISKILGIVMTIAGVVLLVQGGLDAWENGVNWTNLAEMVGGIALIVAGLAIAFGTVGAAIGLIVGGLALLVVGIKDFIDTGELSTEAFTAIEIGILAIGVGLALVLGWIPLVVAAVVALAVAIYKYWDEIKEFTIATWNKVVDFLAGVWNGIKETAITVWSSVSSLVSGWFTDAKNWFDTKLPELVNGIVDWFAKLPEALVEVGKNVVKALWNGICSMGDWLWNKFTGFLGDLGEFAGDILGGFGSGSAESYSSVPHYATGGYPSTGQLFMAREAGAEMVGSIGGRTAVANNDQIVEAVSSGVYNAVMSAMSNRGEASNNFNIYLSGKQLEASVRETKQKRGATIATGGILNATY